LTQDLPEPHPPSSRRGIYAPGAPHNSVLLAAGTLVEWANDLAAAETGLRVRGPFFYDSHPFDLERITEFRDRRYPSRLGYLLCQEQREVEDALRLAQRSAHFCAERDGRIVGTLRITPFPFELEALSSTLAELAPQFAGHAEISRLLVDDGERGSHATMGLLVVSCAWALHRRFDGVVGLCRKGTRIVFERYGLRAVSAASHHVDWRGDQPYTLMVGAWPNLIAATTRLAERLYPKKHLLKEAKASMNETDPQ
jgi:N-acyl-L-homoserine lactone synthetase